MQSTCTEKTKVIIFLSQYERLPLSAVLMPILQKSLIFIKNWMTVCHWFDQWNSKLKFHIQLASKVTILFQKFTKHHYLLQEQDLT